ncbi:MAG: CsiV family protein [Gammaproteobacteria bacterium]
MKFKNLHKILIFLSLFINTIEAEDIYKVEVIIIKFNDVIVNEKFNNNLYFSPTVINKLKENEIILIPEKFIDNALTSSDLLDIEIETIKNDNSLINEKEIMKYFELYEYSDIENLNFLIGRLRWRENIEILNSLSWYQPLEDQDEYTYHYDQENNLSLYLNIYESRYLHLNLKAFLGKLNFDENITRFIDEDRRVKNSEINYFDHPNMGLIIKVDKT